ncbi:hypothetical protein [Bradyrhizobium erythrophlei]|uniref:Uncharacterized protein n=1 Tax=Bradyrhizobium erythrophlei TaxID=1437360 RepID=A0A1M7TES1_9BRAD|nr:hypothetical protein [Bradyrhizobium erythrophlei]SHN69196.1 hypothetical protein SAMN05444170_1511 [Bradyrhizobium erythrophlei]
MSDDVITVERLERALAVSAYLVELDGPKMVPIFERIERELSALRSQQDATERARRLLESYGQPRAIEPPLGL